MRTLCIYASRVLSFHNLFDNSLTHNALSLHIVVGNGRTFDPPALGKVYTSCDASDTAIISQWFIYVDISYVTSSLYMWAPGHLYPGFTSGLSYMWSLILDFADLYALAARCHLQDRRFMRAFTIGDGIKANAPSTVLFSLIRNCVKYIFIISLQIVWLLFIVATASGGISDRFGHELSVHGILEHYCGWK
jgi:hypothetical protein